MMSVNRQKPWFKVIETTVLMTVTSSLMSESWIECMWYPDFGGQPLSLGPIARFQSDMFTPFVRFLHPQMNTSWITWRIHSRTAPSWTIQAGFVKRQDWSGRSNTWDWSHNTHPLCKSINFDFILYTWCIIFTRCELLCFEFLNHISIEFWKWFRLSSATPILCLLCPFSGKHIAQNLRIKFHD